MTTNQERVYELVNRQESVLAVKLRPGDVVIIDDALRRVIAVDCEEDRVVIVTPDGFYYKPRPRGGAITRAEASVNRVYSVMQDLGARRREWREWRERRAQDAP